jgi:DNA polymerase III alpha subunit
MNGHPFSPPHPVTPSPPHSYAELHAKTNFSFLEGASHPDELVRRAAELGYAALAITDRSSLAGVVRAHGAAKEVGLKLLVGAEITPDDAPPAVLLATDRAAYGRLARLITLGRRRAEKGECRLRFDDVAEHAEGLIAGVVGDGGRRKRKGGSGKAEAARGGLEIENCKLRIADCSRGRRAVSARSLSPNPSPPAPLPASGARGERFGVGRKPQGAGPTPRSPMPNSQCAIPNVPSPTSHPPSPLPHPKSSLPSLPSPLSPLHLHRYREVFGDRCYLLAELHQGPDDRGELRRLVHLARAARVKLAAAGDVHYHVPQRRALCDVLAAIRHGTTVAAAGELLFPNAERYLKSPDQVVALFAEVPEAIRHTVEIAERCTFSLDELRYEYPEELAPPGRTPLEHLRRLTWAGAQKRYPRGIPDRVRGLLEHELKLIEELRYEAYFLTVWDLVRFARRRGILCQGRGSAANSAVCYCLGVTSVDPGRMDVLFERFVSRERNEAPDIDVDFEHQRREEVIQYLYEKYGRERAGMTAEVITYRPRSAVREVGKALGLSLDRVDAVAKRIERFHAEPELAARCREAGIDPETPLGRQLVELVGQLVGFPRHLSQHTGGMVITRGPLCELVPIENAAMPERTVIQWNKDDLDELGILKVDCLALGMLTAIRRCFDLVGRHYGRQLTLANIPAGDPDVYEMICRADTIGVFQIESRAQMSMLPRLRPRCFYDLVIEVAIVRPGPIQGNMVHPYLRRRNGEEPVMYPNQAIRGVLEKTLGVPLFQEQAMRLAVVAAGFTPGEADQLRRAMGAWRRPGLIEGFRRKLIDGMRHKGFSPEYAEAVFGQIRGFGDYGFPESHAASFALLVYVSAWLKHHYPAAFTCGLLNSQPMGFYAPAQLVRDARNHGVEVRSVDVNSSGCECTLEGARGEGRGARGQGPGVRDQRVGAESLAGGLARRFVGVQGSGFGGQASQCRGNAHGPRSAGSDAVAKPPADEQELQIENCKLRIANSTPHSPLPTLHSPLSTAHCPLPTAHFALRLGLNMLHGLAAAHAERIEQTRGDRPFCSLEDFARRTGLSRAVLSRLAKAGAFGSLGLTRREALWHALAEDQKELPLFAAGKGDGPKGEGRKGKGEGGRRKAETRIADCRLQIADCRLPATGSFSLPPSPVPLPPSAAPLPPSTVPPPPSPFPLPRMSAAEEVLADYRSTGLSLRAHPLEFLRSELNRMGVVPAVGLASWPEGKPVRVAGIVLVRQRPGTAKGITFVTLEDETGQANLIIRPGVWRRWRQAALGATLMLAHGRLQRQGQIIHVLCTKLEDLSGRLRALVSRSRDFC